MISIIIPCYNSANYIKEAIQSCLNQSYQDFELVIINDGSTDTTDQIIKTVQASTSKIHYSIQPNQGASSARNRGIALAKGDFFLYLDADDKLKENALSVLIQSASSKHITVARWENFYENQQPNETINLPDTKKYKSILAQLVALKPVNSVVLYPANKSIQWNEKLVIWENNAYLHANIIACGGHVQLLDVVTTQIRQHSTPSRISMRYDHFEPYQTGLFFLSQKQLFTEHRLLDEHVAYALDEIVGYNAQQLVAHKKITESGLLLKKVNLKLLLKSAPQNLYTFVVLVFLFGHYWGSNVYLLLRNLKLGRYKRWIPLFR